MNTKLWKSCTIKRCSLSANGGILRILIVSLYGGHKNKNKLVSMYNHFLHTVILLDSFWIFFLFLCICLGSDLIYTNETVGSAKVSFFTFLQSHQNVWISGWYLNIHLYKGKDFVVCFLWWFGSKGRTSLWWLLSLIVRYSVL